MPELSLREVRSALGRVQRDPAELAAIDEAENFRRGEQQGHRSGIRDFPVRMRVEFSSCALTNICNIAFESHRTFGAEVAPRWKRAFVPPSSAFRSLPTPRQEWNSGPACVCYRWCDIRIGSFVAFAEIGSRIAAGSRHWAENCLLPHCPIAHCPMPTACLPFTLGFPAH